MVLCIGSVHDSLKCLGVDASPAREVVAHLHVLHNVPLGPPALRVRQPVPAVVVQKFHLVCVAGLDGADADEDDGHGEVRVGHDGALRRVQVADAAVRHQQQHAVVVVVAAAGAVSGAQIGRHLHHVVDHGREAGRVAQGN